MKNDGRITAKNLFGCQFFFQFTFPHTVSTIFAHDAILHRRHRSYRIVHPTGWANQPSVRPGSVNGYQLYTAGKAKAGMAHSNCGWAFGCAGKTVEIPWDHVPYLSASEVMIHEEALCQANAPLPLPLQTNWQTNPAKAYPSWWRSVDAARIQTLFSIATRVASSDVL